MLQVSSPAVRVEILFCRRVPGNRVDCEVAPARRRFDRQMGVTGDFESAVPTAGLRFRSWQCDVYRPHLVDREGLAHCVDRRNRL